MTRALAGLFRLYLPLGIKRAFLATARVLILPFWKIDEAVPRSGVVLDIGCGEGALANYLSLVSPEREIIGVDISKKRIAIAKTAGNRRSIKFVHADATKFKLPKAECYLLVDVLHHIFSPNQVRLLSSLAQKLDSNSYLIIKEIDHTTRIPFLFGHVFEKLLYPGESIYPKSKKEWLDVLAKLGLWCVVKKGAFYFPDSTLLYICRKISQE